MNKRHLFRCRFLHNKNGSIVNNLNYKNRSILKIRLQCYVIFVNWANVRNENQPGQLLEIAFDESK